MTLDGKTYLTAGVCGAGMMGHRYISNIKDRFSVIHVKSVCSAHMENARKLAMEHNILVCTYEQMLSDSEIEMIICLTPACSHADIIRRALLAGKHVYTEKTMTDDPTTARELMQLAN